MEDFCVFYDIVAGYGRIQNVDDSGGEGFEVGKDFLSFVDCVFVLCGFGGESLGGGYSCVSKGFELWNLNCGI